jgi:hypothetical protein
MGRQVSGEQIFPDLAQDSQELELVCVRLLAASSGHVVNLNSVFITPVHRYSTLILASASDLDPNLNFVLNSHSECESQIHYN